MTVDLENEQLLLLCSTSEILENTGLPQYINEFRLFPVAAIKLKILEHVYTSHLSTITVHLRLVVVIVIADMICLTVKQVILSFWVFLTWPM